MSARLFVYNTRFFTMPGWQWNVFDFFCVGLQFVEEIVMFVTDKEGEHSEHHNTTMFRMLRLIRLVRVLRFARLLHLIQELHMLVNSIIAASNSFLWTVGLLFLISFIVGVYITQIVALHRLNAKEASEPITDPDLIMYWGNLGFTILTLFEAMSGGVDWDVPLRSLMNSVGMWMLPVFLAYVAVTLFILMNLVTGIFVDSAAANIREDKDLRLVNQIRELFIVGDADKTGNISWLEFVDQLNNPLMEEYFKVIDLDMSEARGFFDLLDLEGTGRISSEDFVMGCLRLRGPARAIDLAILMDQSKIIFQHLGRMTSELDRINSLCRGPQRQVSPAIRSASKPEAAAQEALTNKSAGLNISITKVSPEPLSDEPAEELGLHAEMGNGKVKANRFTHRHRTLGTDSLRAAADTAEVSQSMPHSKSEGTALHSTGQREGFSTTMREQPSQAVMRPAPEIGVPPVDEPPSLDTGGRLGHLPGRLDEPYSLDTGGRFGLLPGGLARAGSASSQIGESTSVVAHAEANQEDVVS
jgi:hypothetical protein